MTKFGQAEFAEFLANIFIENKLDKILETLQKQDFSNKNTDDIYAASAQVDDILRDFLHLTAVPFLDRIFFQQIKILMVSVNPQSRPRLTVQPFQPVSFFGGIAPDQAEISADDHIIRA